MTPFQKILLINPYYNDLAESVAQFELMADPQTHPLRIPASSLSVVKKYYKFNVQVTYSNYVLVISACYHSILWHTAVNLHITFPLLALAQLD